MHYASFFNVLVVVQVVVHLIRLADVQVAAYVAMNHVSFQVVAFHVSPLVAVVSHVADHHDEEAVCRVVAHHDVDHHHKHSRPNQS